MDELEISGRRYISSVRAAKEHKYHSDYIGQLVRGGKVVGQKVGRAWYVDADSLAEYLGKEVPARGPMPRVERPEPIEEEKETIAPEVEPEFVMPLRKSGRLHVIEAIDSEQLKAPKKIKEEPVVEQRIEEPAEVEIENALEENIEVFVSEDPQETEEEKETFIPLKINTESVRNIYAEPEDSFYKVSRKGLRYVKPHDQEEPVQEIRSMTAAPRESLPKKSASGKKVFAAAGLVFAAGLLSLGVGVGMSYYLQAVTTIADAGQTSSVILSK